MRRLRRIRSCSTANSAASDPVIQRWLLRILVPLGGHREFVHAGGFNNDALAEILGLGRWIDSFEDDFNLKVVQGELRQLHQQAEQQAPNAPLSARLCSNVARLSELVGLSTTDCRILEFTVSLHTERLLDDAADWLGGLSSAKAFHALSVILDLPEPEISASLSAKGVLAPSGLVSVDRRGSNTLRGKLDLQIGRA